MRVLVLHSDVGPHAPPDELETLATAEIISRTLRQAGHSAELAPFVMPPAAVRTSLERFDAVFNLVESVEGKDGLAATAPFLLEALGVPYTGSGSGPIALASDKPLAKQVMRAAGLPTPDWAEPPLWKGLDEAEAYIVKSATEDASLGLDDGAVARGRALIAARAEASRKRFGGRWFAEAYVDGREFNVALLAEKGALRVLPVPELRFENWPEHKPRIVGYSAKWDERSPESANTIRHFGWEHQAPELARSLTELAERVCALFGVRGYARVDFRVDEEGRPTILEVNPNPSLDPTAGFAAAAREAGLAYEALIAHILEAAL